MPVNDENCLMKSKQLHTKSCSQITKRKQHKTKPIEPNLSSQILDQIKPTKTNLKVVNQTYQSKPNQNYSNKSINNQSYQINSRNQSKPNHIDPNKPNNKTYNAKLQKKLTISNLQNQAYQNQTIQTYETNIWCNS